MYLRLTVGALVPPNADIHIHRKNFQSALDVASYRPLGGQTARIYRKQAELYERNPAATEEQKSNIPRLKQDAEKIKRDVSDLNAASITLPLTKEDEQYDNLVCAYFR